MTSDATWQSSNTAVATVSAGMVTGVSAGEADVTATYQNVMGKVHVTVSPASGPATVSAVSVGGPSPGIGATTQFSATATFSDNTTKEVTNVANWRSSNTAVATVNSGQVRGVAAGDADISATYQNVTGTIHITIGGSSTGSPPSSTSSPTVTLVTVSGNTPAVGNSQGFTATAFFSDGTSKPVATLAVWHSSNTSVATVTFGTVSALAAGQVDISATYQNVTGTIHLVIASTACVFSVFPGTLSIAATGASGIILSVSASSGTNCNWTATVTTGAAFVTITSGASGTGTGSVWITVAANSGVARAAVITIAGVQVAISQAGTQTSGCSPTLLPTSADYSAEMHEGSLTVTVGSGCQWTASTSSTFINLNPPFNSGTGNGSFTYRVFGNLSGAPRSGSINVGQQTFTITQHAALGGNSLSFVSDPGDWIGAGWTLLEEAPTSTFTATLDASGNHLSVGIVGSDGLDTLDWSLNLAAPQGQQLAPGTYLNATRWPFQAPTVPGLDFSGDGRGCNQSSSTFTITDFAYSPAGLTRLTVTFEQHCEGGGPALRGKIVYVQ